VSVVEPQPIPETVSALLDTTWRIADSETARTDGLDRKASTVATFASLVVTLTATLGLRFVERIDEWWALVLFLGGLSALVLAVALSVADLFPREYLSLGMAYLERFPTWSEIRKSPEQVRGETMRGLIVAIAREREANEQKGRFLRCGFCLLVAGLVLIAVEAGTLAVRTVTG
jgi:hypothetical protein